jgi:hypothetical protein
MSTLSHPPTHIIEERPSRFAQLFAREPLTVLAIVLMWLAVAVTAVLALGSSRSVTRPPRMSRASRIRRTACASFGPRLLNL